MSDPAFTTDDYIRADQLIHHMIQNLSLHFQLDGTSFTREQMHENVRKRSILIQARHLILDEGERIIPPKRGGDAM